MTASTVSTEYKTQVFKLSFTPVIWAIVKFLCAHHEQVVRHHKRNHGLHHGHSARHNAGVVPALGTKRGVCTLPRHLLDRSRLAGKQ